VRALPDGSMKNEAASQIIGNIARYDPAAAVKQFSWLPSAAQPQAASQLVNQWAESDIAAAAKWADILPDGQSRNLAYATLSQKWAAQDPVAASQWLSSLPTGDSRDIAVSLFTASAAKVDPQSALQWAESITNPVTRARDIESTVGIWLQKDRSAAESYISSTQSLSAEAKQRLLRGY
jgi:serine protease inhibitor